MTFTKKELNDVLNANLSDEEVVDINEALEQHNIDDIDDVEDNVKFYKTFDDYVQNTYFDASNYPEMLEGPAFSIIDYLKDRVLSGFEESTNIKEALILDSENTTEIIYGGLLVYIE